MASFACKHEGCSFVSKAGPTGLGHHYQENPHHRPASHRVKGQASIEPPPAKAAKGRKTKESYRMAHCPICGLDLAAAELALSMVLRMTKTRRKHVAE